MLVAVVLATCVLVALSDGTAIVVVEATVVPVVVEVLLGVVESLGVVVEAPKTAGAGVELVVDAFSVLT